MFTKGEKSMFAKGEKNMFTKIKKILQDKRGLHTIEILGWVAVISLILVAVVTKLQPDIVGTDSILTNSSARITSLESIMKP